MPSLGVTEPASTGSATTTDWFFAVGFERGVQRLYIAREHKNGPERLVYYSIVVVDVRTHIFLKWHTLFCLLLLLLFNFPL